MKTSKKYFLSVIICIYLAEALVPLIKLTLYDVQIDLLISRIPVNFLRDNPNFFEG
jgi:hypothetical protein